MTEVAVWYASAPTNEYAIASLEFNAPGVDPIRICNGFEDQWLSVGGVPQLFTAVNLAVALPAKNTTGQQTLRFGFPADIGAVQKKVDEILASGSVATMTYRMYLASDPSVPAETPRVMTVVGGTFEGIEAIFEGSYFDILNTAWPRDFYTAESAPGVQYL